MSEKCPFCGGEVERIVLRWKAGPHYVCSNKECVARDVDLSVGMFEAVRALKAENERLRKALGKVNNSLCNRENASMRYFEGERQIIKKALEVDHA